MAENSTRYGIEIGKDIAEQIRIAAEKTGCDPQAYATAALKAGLETLTAEQSHQTRRASTARARAKNPPRRGRSRPGIRSAIGHPESIHGRANGRQQRRRTSDDRGNSTRPRPRHSTHLPPGLTKLKNRPAALQAQQPRHPKGFTDMPGKHVALTFTGVDEDTDLNHVSAIALMHPHVEFGVLAGTKTGSEKRFPGPKTIAALAKAAPKTALHCCGRLSRAIMSGNRREVLKLARGFRRIQVNSLTYKASPITLLALESGLEVIVQLREWPPPATMLDNPRITGLWDRSGGKGIAQIEAWPTPSGCRMGYAGGLDPEKLPHALAKLEEMGATDTWLDTESGVRSGDHFDLDKVEAMIAIGRRAAPPMQSRLPWQQTP